MSKPSIFYLLIVLFCIDLSYSFIQHMSQPLDGDLPWIVAPADELLPLLENPSGLLTIIADSSYFNPNRYFSHASLHHYMGEAPIILQVISEPIQSVYLASALAKTLVQFALILALAAWVNRGFSIKETNFWLAVILITPLFQTNGYQDFMGVIDPSITYTFFYALPLLLLLTYLIPVFYRLQTGNPLKLHSLLRALHFLLLPIVCLSGPLNPGIALVLVFVIALAYLSKGLQKSDDISKYRLMLRLIRSIPNELYGYLIPLAVFSFYSLYIAGLGSFAQASSIPIAEIYANLPHGLWKLISTKIGLPLLISAVIINSVIIRHRYSGTTSKVIRASILWISIFILVYCILLPLGGYRSYRPDTLRFDTFLPATVCLIFLYASTSLFLLEQLTRKKKLVYSLFLVMIAAIFTFADKPEFKKNDCEKAAFAEVASSPLDIVELDNECTVMDWSLFQDPEHSRLRGKALNRWGITDREKLYFNRP